MKRLCKIIALEWMDNLRQLCGGKMKVQFLWKYQSLVELTSTATRSHVDLSILPTEVLLLTQVPDFSHILTDKWWLCKSNWEKLWIKGLTDARFSYQISALGFLFLFLKWLEFILKTYLHTQANQAIKWQKSLIN